ncbi:MAG: hypothetical protein R3Y21_00120 [Mycoplasmatota bacterium]
MVEKLNLEIKATFKKLIKNAITLFIIIFAAFYLFDLKIKLYQEEYESTTWYITDATFKYSKSYTETKETNDEYIEVEYFDWYFSYIGNDGNTYQYIQKKENFDADESKIVQIYVDEYDNSHSLEIKNYNSDNVNWAKNLTVALLVIPYIFIFGLTFLTLFIRRSIAKKKEKAY